MRARESGPQLSESTPAQSTQISALRTWFQRALLVALSIAPINANAEEKPSPALVPHAPKGTLILAGGGRNEAPIRKAFLDALPRNEENIQATLIPTGTADEDIPLEVKVTQTHWKIDGSPITWSVLHTRNRQTAENPDFAQTLERTHGVWMSGGKQERLAIYSETVTAQKIRDVLRRGGVVGGTSSGASITSSIAIMEGKPPKMGRGLGLTPHVIDQHFTQRNRQERLLEALRMVEGAGGIGIDENTALVIRGGETAEVIGIGNVYIYFLNQEKPLILHPGETINFSTGKVVQGKKDNLIEDVQEVRKAN